MRRHILQFSLALALLPLAACSSDSKEIDRKSAPTVAPDSNAVLCQAGDFLVRLNAGKDIRFRLHLDENATGAQVVHGGERIEIDEVSYNKDSRSLRLAMPIYDAFIEATLSDDCQSFSGIYSKRRTKEREVISLKAKRHEGTLYESGPQKKARTLLYDIDFSESDKAVGRFELEKSGRVTGTILTPTGDYRYLEGALAPSGELRLSAFDFAHAFLFSASPMQKKMLESKDRDPLFALEGLFSSGRTWREAFSAHLNDKAALPDDGFLKLKDNIARIDGDFITLDAKSVKAPSFLKGPMVIDVFGTWCPNCSDAARDLNDIHAKYKAKGLRVVGLGFEFDDDVKRSLTQLKRYKAHHQIEYDLFLGGTANKTVASSRLPFVGMIRAWPTTIFIDKDNKVRAVHSGYSGPATDAEYEKQKALFAKNIEALF